MRIISIVKPFTFLLAVFVLTTSISGCFTNPDQFIFLRKDKYLSIGKSWGAFVKTPNGPTFASVEKWDEDKALLYIYRPHSEWAAQEIQAPSVWINGKNRAVSLANSTYAWFELEPGRFDIKMLRGLWGIERLNNSHFGFITDFVLEVEAGKEYYLRYSEVMPAPIDKSKGYIPVGDGPMQLIPKGSAWPEITQAKFIVGDGGRQFAALPPSPPEQPASGSKLAKLAKKINSRLFGWDVQKEAMVEAKNASAKPPLRDRIRNWLGLSQSTEKPES